MQEELTLLQRLIQVLFNPRRSFEAVLNKETAHDWLVPTLLVCAVGIMAHFLTLDVLTNLETPQVQEALHEMSEEEQERYLEGMRMLRTHGWLMVPLGVFSSLLMLSAVLMLFTKWILSAEVTFRQMLVVKAYGSMVLIPEWLVRTPLVLLTGNPDIRTGPGALLDQSQTQDFFGRMLNAINLFDLWQLWILAVGISVFSGTANRKAGITLVIAWLLWIITGAWLEGVDPGPPPGA